MLQPIIRPAAPRDLPAVHALYDTARRYMQAHRNPTQWPEDYPSQEILRRDLAGESLYVGVDDGDAVHMAFVLAPGPDPTYGEILGAWPDDLPYGVIHRLASDRTIPGAFDACLAFCRRRFPRIRVDTHRRNRIMRHLLASRGFRYCGVIRVADGTPRLAYQLSETGTP